MRWNAELLGAMAWSVLALTLGGSSLLYLLIQKGAAASVTSLMYLVPPVTALMAWMLFARAHHAHHGVGHAADGFGGGAGGASAQIRLMFFDRIRPHFY